MRGYGHEPSSPSIFAADRLITAANAINATLYDKLAFDISRNIVPVGSLARTPNVMEVHPSVPVRTVREFIAYAKGDPGRITYGALNGTNIWLASCSK
jgi:tripartite-type tricarboxylate transporter receptor subunit TctC